MILFNYHIKNNIYFIFETIISSKSDIVVIKLSNSVNTEHSFNPRLKRNLVGISK
jgi:hypothetical protein